MSFTSCDAKYICKKTIQHANKYPPFGFKGIINFIMKEVQMFESENSPDNANEVLTNAINIQIMALIGITVIYMLLMDMIIYFDK